MYNKDIEDFLCSRGVDFIHFVDIRSLSQKENKNYSYAILFGIKLSKQFIKNVTQNPDYVREMVNDNKIKNDEFYLTELKTDGLADETQKYIQSLGFDSYSQSEKNIYETGFYDSVGKNTPLPHKTIGRMAGMGWLGKNNLLITKEFGCAYSMCSVLTNLPLKCIENPLVKSSCGVCQICKQQCKVYALEGKNWKLGISKSELIDVNKCNTCLRCMIMCPWTQKLLDRE